MQKLATIERITSLVTHPNADNLDIVTVLGYKCVVTKGEFRNGQKVVFIQPDSCLESTNAWALNYKKTKRVRSIKIRGEFSFGIVLDPMIVLKEITPWYLAPINDFGFKFLPPVGTDVSKALEITKYQSPAEKAGVPNAKLNYLPFGIPKTDEERYQNLKPKDLHLGEKVTVTQKIDGSSFTAYCVLPGHSNNKELERGICSRSLVLQEEGDSKYHLAEKKYDLLNKLEAYCVKHNCSLAVRGEIYGQGIQAFSNNPHSKLPLDLAVFSVYNIKEQQYERNDRVALFDYRNVAGALGLPTVPELEPSIFITLEKIHEYENSTEKMEGVVIKGVNFSYKVINLNYDSKK